ncbi:MAG: hypothetical protein KZQ94_15980 [Candidatus Thiodiazotropha sp. (ex Troendleina suluensis)]|nr:hypothetical protein [Candidatus Thiodiazotropha sp. (ex Troendleina suluensis)]
MPDIGNTTEFANYNYLWEGNGNDTVRGIQITMTEDGTASSISAYITTEANSARTVVYAIYDSSGTLLAYSDESAGSHTDEALLELSLANEVSAGDLDLTNGSSYYLLAAFSGGTGAGGIANAGAPNTVGYTGDNSSTYPALAATAGTISQSQPDFSIFLTYDAGGVSGTGAGNLTAITGVASGASTVGDVTGTAAGTISAITASASGSADAPLFTGTAAGTLSAITSDSLGIVLESGWESIIFSGTVPPASEESLYEGVFADYPAIPEIVSGDIWGVESHASITWDTNSQAVIDPNGAHQLGYWFWDVSTKITYSGDIFINLSTGTSAGVLAAITSSGAGAYKTDGDGIGVLQAITASASGGVGGMFGTAAGVLEAITATADGGYTTSSIYGGAIATLESISGSGTATHGPTGSASGLLQLITSEAIGLHTSSVAGTASGFLSAITGDGIGAVPLGYVVNPDHKLVVPYEDNLLRVN